MLPTPDYSTIPARPGCYQFFQDDRLLYVGKAKSLRARLANYFQAGPHHGNIDAMLTRANRLEWIELKTEHEAFLLEARLIAESSPPYNLRLYDDASHPFIALDRRGPSPKLTLWRGPTKKGVTLFGPFASRTQARSLIDAVLTVAPLRPCSDTYFRVHAATKTPCIQAEIGRCAAPCVDPDVASLVERVTALLSGRTSAIIADLTARRDKAATDLNFELAARLRDQLKAFDTILATQRIVSRRSVNIDVLTIAQDPTMAILQVLRIRNGAIVAVPSISIDHSLRLPSTEDLANAAVAVYYSKAPAPTTVITDLDISPTTANGVGAVFRPARTHRQREWLDLASTSAAASLKRQHLSRASDLATRSLELATLAEQLGLKKAPLRIEAVDISHLNGQGTVSTISVLIDGLPSPKHYRRYRLTDLGHPDDYYSMREVLTRRLSDKTRPLPDLLLIDGGPGQLGVAVAVAAELGLTEKLDIISLAKRLEEVFIPGRPEPVLLPLGSPSLYLLQRARDETHRASNVYQKRLRSPKMLASVLDDIPGLGAKRKERLLGQIKTIKELDDLTASQLKERFPFLPEATCEALATTLNPAASANPDNKNG